jgi:N-sulfoglucosamine sulfohydrolase
MITRRTFIKAAGISTLATLKVPSKEIGSCQRPNILFVISDDQSWPHAGAYGCNFVKTPAFDRVAKEGILFQNVFAAARVRLPPCAGQKHR